MPTRPVAALTLKLHGRAAVRFADGREQALEGRSAALVALVALESDARREQVAALLWPESEDPRRNLRQQLLRLKAALGGAALVQGESQLRLAPEVTLAMPASQGEAGAPLLGSLTFPDCPNFQAWLDTRRGQQQASEVQALLAQASAAEEEGRYDEALASAQRALALDQGSEAHHRLVMRLHYLRGDRAAGLAAFDRLQRWLHTRHGLKPDAASQALARALRESQEGPGLHPSGIAAASPSVARPAGQPEVATQAPAPNALPVRSPSAVPVTVLRPPRLIGREAALAALHAAWGEQRAALVLGEAGLGKSRLLAEFTAPWLAASAAGRPGDSGIPYATLARVLRRLREVTSRMPMPTPVLTQTQAAALAVVLPPAADEAAAPAGQPAAQGDIRLALLGAIETTLTQAQQQGLAALVVDDLHFADAASIEALQFLISCESLAGLRFALAARPAEISPAGEALRSALIESRLLEEITLAALTVEQMTALVGSLGVQELDTSTLGPALARHSGGNPLYALETVKLGLADGSLRAGNLPMPQGVGALIERRLKSLSAPALALARVAAIAGVDFDIELAEEAIGTGAVQLAPAWEELQSAQVLRDDSFAHDLVADAVLRTVPQPVARRLHESAARWLQARNGEPARRAMHWAAAGRPAEAGVAWQEAAARANAASRHGDELALLIRAADAFATARNPNAEFEVMRLAASAVQFVDVGDATRAVGDRLLALASSDLQRAQALAEVAFIDHCLHDLVASEAHGLEGAALAARLARPDIAFAAERMASVAMASVGRAAEALACIDRHRDWVLTHGSDENRGEYHGDRSWALSKLGRLLEARADLLLALKYSQEGQRLGDMNITLHLLAACERRMGNAASAISRIEQALAQHEQLVTVGGMPDGQWLSLGVLLRDTGQYGRALEALAHGTHRPGADGVLDAITLAIKLARVQALLDLGRPDLAWQALPEFDPAWYVVARANWHLRRGRLKRALGESAQADFDQCLSIVGDSGVNNVRGIVLVDQALAARDEGAFERVAAVAAETQAQQAFGLCITCTAAAAWLSQSSDVARQYAARAQELMASYSHEEASPAFVWLLLAQTYERHGDEAQAAAAWAEGAAWVRRAAATGVPQEFQTSFVERNPVHRMLLARAPNAAPRRD